MRHFIGSRLMRDLVLGLCLGLGALSLLLWPEQSAQAMKDGLALCRNVIIPALFPFFVLSSLVVDLGISHYLGRLLAPLMVPLFQVNGTCACALVLGLVGGYPVGARTAIQLYLEGQCTQTEAERLLAFCNNCGPAFVLGMVGAGIFGSSAVGLALYLTHLAASLLVGILFRFYRPESALPQAAFSRTQFQAVRFSAAFPRAVTSALQSSLNICAFVLFFSVMVRILNVSGLMDTLSGVLSTLLAPFGFPPSASQKFLVGLLELSSGVASLTDGSFAHRLPLAAFMLGWAGLSVHCQVLAFLNDSGLSIKTYLFGKLLHGCLSALLAHGMIQLGLLSVSVSAFLADQTQTIPTPDFQQTLTISAAAAWSLWLVFLFLTLFAAKKSSRKMHQYGL